MLATKASQFQSSIATATTNTWGLDSDVLRLIYHGALEPLILYCMSAFQHVLNKKWVQKKLIVNTEGLYPEHFKILPHSFHRRSSDSRYSTTLFNSHSQR